MEHHHAAYQFHPANNNDHHATQQHSQQQLPMYHSASTGQYIPSATSAPAGHLGSLGLESYSQEPTSCQYGGGGESVGGGSQAFFLHNSLLTSHNSQSQHFSQQHYPPQQQFSPMPMYESTNASWNIHDYYGHSTGNQPAAHPHSHHQNWSQLHQNNTPYMCAMPLSEDANTPQYLHPPPLLLSDSHHSRQNTVGLHGSQEWSQSNPLQQQCSVHQHQQGGNGGGLSGEASCWGELPAHAHQQQLDDSLGGSFGGYPFNESQFDGIAHEEDLEGEEGFFENELQEEEEAGDDGEEEDDENFSSHRQKVMCKIEALVLLRLRELKYSAAAAAAPVAGRRTLTKSAAAASIKSAHNEALVARELYKTLRSGTICTQRDIYYKLVHHFESQLVVNDAIRTLANTLGVPRNDLCVVSGARGFIGGDLVFNGVDLRNSATGCAITGHIASTFADEQSQVGGNEGAGGGGATVDSQSHQRLEKIKKKQTNGTVTYTPTVQSEARHILLVEKEAVYCRLLDQGIHKKLPLILITGRGFPDTATRALASFIAAELQRQQDEKNRQSRSPSQHGSQSIVKRQEETTQLGDEEEEDGAATAVPVEDSSSHTIIKNSFHLSSSITVLGLVDYNPHGVHILLQYMRGGNANKRDDSTTVKGIPGLKWLGLHHQDIQQQQQQQKKKRFLSAPAPLFNAAVSQLNARDKNMLARLLQSFGHTAGKDKKEKRQMEMKVASKKRKKMEEALPKKVDHPWLRELIAMQEGKAEIEALYHALDASSSSLSFADVITQKILRRQYI